MTRKLQFKAMARRNKLLGLVGRGNRCSASPAPTPRPMPRRSCSPTSRKPAITTYLRKVAADFEAKKGIEEDAGISALTMTELMAQAIAQIKQNG